MHERRIIIADQRIPIFACDVANPLHDRDFDPVRIISLGCHHLRLEA
jgi:hypothetical protein